MKHCFISDERASRGGEPWTEEWSAHSTGWAEMKHCFISDERASRGGEPWTEAWSARWTGHRQVLPVARRRHIVIVYKRHKGYTLCEPTS
jgi:hypothetical protein